MFKAFLKKSFTHEMIYKMITTLTYYTTPAITI